MNLVYAESAKCPCGALLAYERPADPFKGAWDCSAILLNQAAPSGHPDAVQHTALLPFIFYEVREARQ